MRQYARLRRDAYVHRGTIRGALQAPRSAPGIEPTLCHFRAWFLGAALLIFDLNYGDLIRWLGGEYTNAHRDWGELASLIEDVKEYSQRPGYPPLDHDRALRACTQGVPLMGHFRCTIKDTV